MEKGEGPAQSGKPLQTAWPRHVQGTVPVTRVSRACAEGRAPGSPADWRVLLSWRASLSARPRCRRDLSRHLAREPQNRRVPGRSGAPAFPPDADAGNHEVWLEVLGVLPHDESLPPRRGDGEGDAFPRDALAQRVLRAVVQPSLRLQGASLRGPFPLRTGRERRTLARALALSPLEPRPRGDLLAPGRLALVELPRNARPRAHRVPLNRPNARTLRADAENRTGSVRGVRS